MLKKLFYASSSVLMLAVIFYLGATYAHGQSGDPPVGYIGAGQNLVAVLTANGDVYIGNSDLPGNGWHYSANVGASAGRPGGQFTVLSDRNGFYALAANGDVFRNTSFEAPAGAWTYINNVFGSSTPAAQRTFGQLKAQYRK